MNQPSSEDQELEAALASLDPSQPPQPVSPGSPTLGALAATRRPKVATACEICPMSLWFASPVELKCYCRAMYLITWSSKEPSQITHCDGQFLGQA